MSFQESFEQLKDFDYEDGSKLGVWPLPAKVIVCILIVCAVLAGVYYFKIKDLKMSMVRVVSEEQTLRSEFELKSAQAANLEAYRAQMEEMQISFKSLLARLPDDTQVPGLLEDIDKNGESSGSDIESIELEPVRQAEYYVELPISIKIVGGYHDFGNFVSATAGMPRIVTLHDFTISKQQDGGDLMMEIAAKTYHYKPQGDEDDE